VRRRPIALALLVAALLASGCGAASSDDDSTADFSGEQRLVANTLEDFESATSDGEEAKLCREFFTRALVDAFTKAGGNCAKGVEDALEDADAFDLKVQKVDVSGTTATARVAFDVGDKDKVREVGLEKSGRSWRLSELP